MNDFNFVLSVVLSAVIIDFLISERKSKITNLLTGIVIIFLIVFAGSTVYELLLRVGVL